MKKILLVLLLIGMGFCKEGNAKFTEEQKNLVRGILESNQIIHDGLLKEDAELPSVAPLLDSFKKASSITSKEITESISLLEKINSTKKDEYMSSLSTVSENIGTLAKQAELTEFNKFYCPMVNKYWVAKGQKIENPYAPEMRECGEVIK